MSSHTRTQHRHYLIGGGLSVMVHGAALLGFSGTLSNVTADEAPHAALVWVETVAGEEASSAESRAPGPSARSRSSSAAVQRAPRARAATSQPAAPGSGETQTPGGTVSDAAAQPSPTIPGVGVAPGNDGAGAGTIIGGSSDDRDGSGVGHGVDTAVPVQGPRLLAAGNPCAGYFPAGAQVAHGRVQVEVEVAANGRIAATRVVVEQPLGEGFGGAARACAATRLRFAPAHTAQGAPVAGQARLLLSFDRS